MDKRNQDIKSDAGKLCMELIPTSAYKSLGTILTYGAKKYKPNSWQQVEKERYVGALLRHFTEYLDDPQSVDEESGYKHIEHVFSNAMFLNHFEAEKENKNESK